MKHQNYWDEKTQRAEKAKAWTKFVRDNYGQYIRQSIDNTIMYAGNDVLSLKADKNVSTEIVVEGIDTVSATMNAAKELINTGKRICVLNFASYKEPGGMFINGSKAQEECICHESTLYPVLKEFNGTYYAQNNQAKNRALYLNRALYSPGIIFVQNNEAVFADVLTCAAPNFKAAKEHCNVTEDENYRVLQKRCEFVLDIMQANNVNVPILGAYGCGVFGQDAKIVATIFKELLNNPLYSFEKVIFAVIPGPNLDDFKSVFADPMPIENASKDNVSNDWVNLTDADGFKETMEPENGDKEFVSLGMVEINSETEVYLIRRDEVTERKSGSFVSHYDYLDVICYGINGVRKFLDAKKDELHIVGTDVDLRNLPTKMYVDEKYTKYIDEDTYSYVTYMPVRVSIKNMFM